MNARFFTSQSPAAAAAKNRLKDPKIYGTRHGALGSLAKTRDQFAVNNAKGDTSQNAALIEQARAQAASESGNAMRAEANQEAMAMKAQQDAQQAINPPEPEMPQPMSPPMGAQQGPQSGQFYGRRRRR